MNTYKRTLKTVIVSAFYVDPGFDIDPDFNLIFDLNTNPENLFLFSLKNIQNWRII